MAVSDEIKAQRGKIKEMSFKEKISYFWEYYRIPFFIVAAVIILASFLIHDIATAKPYGFYAMLINASPSTQETDLEQSFSTYADIDTAKYDCYIDTATTLNLNSTNQYDMASIQKIMAVVAAGDLDTMVADYNSFSHYAMNDTFTDLRKVLSKDQLAKYSDDFYYVDYAVITAAENEDVSSESASDSSVASTLSSGADMLDNSSSSSVGTADQFVKPDPSTMTTPVPVGIILSDAAALKDADIYTGTVPVLGITQNTARIEEALKFIDYLFQK